jgi:hypothetical protein
MITEYLITFFLCITVILLYFCIIMMCMNELTLGFIFLIVGFITGIITIVLSNYHADSF